MWHRDKTNSGFPAGYCLHHSIDVWTQVHGVPSDDARGETKNKEGDGRLLSDRTVAGGSVPSKSEYMLVVPDQSTVQGWPTTLFRCLATESLVSLFVYGI